MTLEDGSSGWNGLFIGSGSGSWVIWAEIRVVFFVLEKLESERIFLSVWWCWCLEAWFMKLLRCPTTTCYYCWSKSWFLGNGW